MSLVKTRSFLSILIIGAVLCPSIGSTKWMSKEAKEEAAKKAKEEELLKTPSDKKVFKSISHSDIKKFVQRFKIKFSKENRNQLQVVGLIPPGCAEHLRIQLETPSESEGTFDYGVRIEATDIYSLGDSKVVLKKASESCDPEEVKMCEPDTCVKISNLPGAQDLQDFEFTSSADVKYCTYDRHADEDDDSRHKCEPFTEKQGGPLTFTSDKDRAAQIEKDKKREKSEMIKAKCAEAEEGDEGAIEDLEFLLGPEAKSKKYSELLKKLRLMSEEKKLKDLEERVDATDSIDLLNDLVDEIAEYANEQGRDKKLVQKSIDLLVKIADKSDPAFAVDENNRLYNARLKLVDRALTEAHRLDPKNKGITYNLYAKRLEGYNWAPTSGDSSHVANAIKRGSVSYKTVQNLAKNYGEPFGNLKKEYDKSFDSAMVPIYGGFVPNQGPNIIGYIPGTKLEETFTTQTAAEQYKEYMRKYQETAKSMGVSVPNGQNSSFGTMPAAAPNIPVVTP